MVSTQAWRMYRLIHDKKTLISCENLVDSLSKQLSISEKLVEKAENMNKTFEERLKTKDEIIAIQDFKYKDAIETGKENTKKANNKFLKALGLVILEFFLIVTLIVTN